MDGPRVREDLLPFPGKVVPAAQQDGAVESGEFRAPGKARCGPAGQFVPHGRPASTCRMGRRPEPVLLRPRFVDPQRPPPVAVLRIGLSRNPAVQLPSLSDLGRGFPLGEGQDDLEGKRTDVREEVHALPVGLGVPFPPDVPFHGERQARSWSVEPRVCVEDSLQDRLRSKGEQDTEQERKHEPHVPDAPAVGRQAAHERGEPHPRPGLRESLLCERESDRLA